MSEESSSSDEENASTASLLKGFIKKLFPWRSLKITILTQMKELSDLSKSNAPKLERLEQVLKNCALEVVDDPQPALNVPPSSADSSCFFVLVGVE